MAMRDLPALVPIAAIGTRAGGLRHSGSFAGVRRAEHDQQRQVFGDVDEAVLLPAGTKITEPGPTSAPPCGVAIRAWPAVTT